jgi:hypothetical protein
VRSPWLTHREKRLLYWLIVLLLIAVAVGAGLWLYRKYALGDLSLGGFFGPRPERRLGVSEQASVDGRRRLVLVRRDNVEHLIMTGGPVDIVIETGIAVPQAKAPALESLEPRAPGFTRQARTFGQAIGE